MDDNAALARLMEQYAPMVTAVVSGMLGRGHRRDTEEVTADVFFLYWRAEKYDESETGTRNLLLTIARRQAINRLRVIARHNDEIVSDELLDAELADGGLWEDDISASIDRQTIRAVIDGLTPPDNEIFVRRYYYCQPVKEIARAMHLPAKTVENRLYLGKKKIREQLLAHGIGHDLVRPGDSAANNAKKG
ncbi:MAG: RNA polymerase sigma factor [Clostridia bacterium]|nr:RNA polymerase sigma factor [Clostridia bacterium]